MSKVDGIRYGGQEDGRQNKGNAKKATADVKAAAQAFTTDALEALVHIMKAGESEAARVAAANAILDRGHGKARQSMDIDADVKATVTKIERTIVRPPHPNR
ncbi:hypothetical protein [Caulobacter segnis]